MIELLTEAISTGNIVVIAIVAAVAIAQFYHHNSSGKSDTDILKTLEKMQEFDQDVAKRLNQIDYDLTDIKNTIGENLVETTENIK